MSARRTGKPDERKRAEVESPACEAEGANQARPFFVQPMALRSFMFARMSANWQSA